jgi:acyl carrier protein
MSQRDTDLLAIFTETLKLPSDYPAGDLEFAKTPGWDSLAHMSIVAAMEDKFGLMMDVDEIAEMSNFAKAQEILDKHGV